MPPKGKKPAAAGGKKEEKSETKKPPQEKKPENAPAKAKKEGAAKPAPAKKDAPKQGAGGDKGKDKGKKRKLNETTQGKQVKPAAGSDSKKKKTEKKVQGKVASGEKKSGAKKTAAKKPVKKQMVKTRFIRRTVVMKRRLPRVGKQELVTFEGNRFFLLPSGKLKPMLNVKLEENDKIAKVEGVFIRKADVRKFEHFKASIKGASPNATKRKIALRLRKLKRLLIKDLVKEAKKTNKQAVATPKDAEREIKLMTKFSGALVRKKAVPRMKGLIHNKTSKIKMARKEKGPKELTADEKKVLDRYIRKLLDIEHYKLQQALLSKRPSAPVQKKTSAKEQKGKKPAKKPAPAKAKAQKADKAGASKKPAAKKAAKAAK